MAVTISGFRPVEKVEREYRGRSGKPTFTIGANSGSKGLYARLSKSAAALIGANGEPVQVGVFSNGKTGKETELLIVLDKDGAYTLSKSGSLSGTSIAAALGTAPAPGSKIVMRVEAWSQGQHRGLRAHS